MADIILNTFGIDRRNRNGLGLAFRNHGPPRYVIDDDRPGDVMLVDGDAVGADEVVARELAGSGRPLLLLAMVKDYALDGEPRARVLTKPVSVAETLSALDRLVAAGPVEPVPASPAEPVPAGPVEPVATGGEVTPPGPPRAGAAERVPARPPSKAIRPPLGPDSATSTINADVVVRPPSVPVPTLVVERGQPPVPPSTATSTPQSPPPSPMPVEAEPDSPEAVVVERPVDMRIAGQLMLRSLTRSSDWIKIPPGTWRESYDPAQHLDGCLAALIAQADASGQGTGLVVDGNSIGYDPATRTFASTGYFDWLDDLARSGVPCSHYMVSDASDLFLAEHSSRDANQVVWRAALLSGAGRLRTGIDRTHPLRLRRWPDLTNLALAEDMIPVLAAISVHSLSVIDLISAGNAPHIVTATVVGLAALDAIAVAPELRRSWLTIPESPERSLRERLRRWRSP